MIHRYTLLVFLLMLTSPFVTAQVQFCGESVPLEQPDVRQRWERSQNLQPPLSQQLSRYRQRAATVFPVIDPILDRYNVPKEIKYLLLVQSVRRNYPASSGDRAGFWQLPAQTARRLGLMVAGRHRDQRYDLARSTAAACQYLTQLRREFSSWALAAVAFDLGPTAVRRIREQAPQASAFSPAYQSDGRVWLFPAIALKELMTNPLASTRNQPPAPPIRSLYPEPTRRNATGNPLTTRPASLSEANAFRRVRMLAEDGQSETPAPVPATPTAVVPPPVPVSTPVPTPVPASVPVSVVAESAANLVSTRSIGNDLLVEGQSVLFEVVQPQNLNGLRLAVGDLIYAHIETLNASAGRVFLRTDRLMSARTQESIRVNLVAVERPKQPGVPLPVRAGSSIGPGWRLTWELP